MSVNLASNTWRQSTTTSGNWYLMAGVNSLKSHQKWIRQIWPRKFCPQKPLRFSAKWFLDCKIIFKTPRIRILIDLSLAQLTSHYALSIMRLGGYVRYRTFSTGIFYALHVTTMDYHSTILLQHSCLYAFCMILPVFLTLGMESQFIFTRLFWTIAFHTSIPIIIFLAIW